jgi:EmrB/QacA subfamily drug resistance transporter
MTANLLPTSATGRRIPSWAVLAICCIAQFMVVLDISIVNVALPQMRHALHLSVAGQQWVVNAYTLTFAGFLLLGGRAADLFGRRRVFMVGLGLFTAFSLLGGLAQSGAMLIFARAAQGIGGAILAPATLSLLTTRFTAPDERRKALGAWSTTAASGAAIGVLLGGVLTDLLDWRWVLFVNVPIGLALLAGSAVALTESKNDGVKRSLDLPGAVTVTAGLALSVYAIVGTDTHPWGSLQTLGTLALGLALLATFFVIEARFAAEPLVPLSVFRRRSLSAANGVAVTIGASLFGTFFFLALFLQQIDGYSPLVNGLATLPSALGTFAATRVATRLVKTLGPRRQLVLGPLVAASGLFWLSALAPGQSYAAHILAPVVLTGFGFGLSFVPMVLAATVGLPSHQAGLASGLINTTRQIGGAIGLAVLATVASTLSMHHAAGVSAIQAALAHGYDRAFLLSGAVLVLGAAVALALPRLPAPAAAPVAVPAGAGSGSGSGGAGEGSGSGDVDVSPGPGDVPLVVVKP